MKKDDQPENYNYERYCARRVSMSPKKSGKKKESAREKDGTHIAFFTEPHPGSRGTGPPDDDGGI